MESPTGSAGTRSSDVRLRAAVVLLGLLVAIAAVYPTIKLYLQAAAYLMQCNGDKVPRLIRPVLDSHIESERVFIPGPDGSVISATLYSPAGDPDAPGMVIVHGLDPGGMAGMEGLARLEASLGLRVLTPDVQTLKSYSVASVNSSSLTEIGESTRWLANRTGHPVALMGISFGAGLALTAASQKEYASSVRIMFDVGGYDSLPRVFQFYKTGVDPGPDGETTRVQPSRWVSYFLEYSDLTVLGSKQDIAAFEPILYERIVNEAHHPKGGAEKVAAMIAHLSPEQARRFDAFLHRPHAAEFDELMQKGRRQMELVSPHGEMQDLTASVYVLHGLNDSVIPSSEALWLRKDLPVGNLKGFLISPLIAHVSIKGRDTTWRDKVRLVQCIYQVHAAAIAPYRRISFWTRLGSMVVLFLIAVLLMVAEARSRSERRQQRLALELTGV